MAPVKSASDLYGLPLDQFTPERDALAKQLRSDGDREEADRIKKLRKPTVAAWAVNQLVRTQPKLLDDLLDAGDAVAAAQTKGQADKLRQAAGDQREAVATLMSRAEGLLDSDGRTLVPAVLERVSQTLRAAAIDPGSREQVTEGHLAKELQFTGLAGFGTVAPAASPQNDEHEKEERRKETERKAAAKRAHEEAKHDLRQARQELAAAEKDLKAAQGQRDRAGAAAEQAERTLEQARDDLKQVQRGGR